MLVVLMSDGHTSAERTLREGTHLDRLIDDRRLLQAAVAGELTGIVEGATHRRVATTLSATRLDPNLSAEIFLFEAGGSPGAAVPGSGASPPV